MGEIIFKDLDDGAQSVWFIAWIGSVNNPMVNGTATINVLLYPLKAVFDETDFLGKDFELDYWRYKMQSIDVGLLPVVRIGQLVRGGRIVRQAHQYAKKYQIEINIEDPYDQLVLPIENFYKSIKEKILTEPIRNSASKQNEIKTIKIKEYAFPFITFHKSQVICLRKGKEQSTDFDLILVPCIDSIGFYFCTSDNLAQELFTGGLQHKTNTIFDEKNLTSPDAIAAGQKPHIRLRYRIPDEDAKVVERIAYDPHAKRAALSIYNSLRRGSANNSYLFPTSFFPFKGKSNLTICGREIFAYGPDNVYKGKKILLVYNILSCSGEFPHKEYEWSRDNDGNQVNPGKSPNDNGWAPPGGGGGSGGGNGNDNKNVRTGGSYNRSFNRLTSTQYEERYLYVVNGEKVKIGREIENKKKPPLPPSKPTNDFTPDPSSSDRAGQGQLDLKTNTDGSGDNDKKPSDNPKKEYKIRSKDRYVKHFNEILELFEKTNKCDFFAIADSDSEYLHFDPVNYLLTDPDEFDFRSPSYKWATGGYLKGPTGKREWRGKRQSLAVCIVERESGNSFTLIEVLKTEGEKKQSGFPIACLVKSEEPEIISEEDIKGVLKTFAINRGVGLTKNQNTNLLRVFVNHYFDHGATTTYNSIILLLNKSGFNFPEAKKEKPNDSNKGDVVNPTQS